MSLQVWLPLNGDLHNQGLANLSFVSGSPSYKVGKIGANALNLNNRITFDCSALANLQTFSICFWAMAEPSSTLTTNWQDIFGFKDVSSGGTNGTFRWETTYASTDGIHWHDNTTNALVNGSHNHITVKSIWVHCCVVFDNNAGKIYSYDNGVLTQTHNHAGGKFNSTGRFYLGETNNIEGKINDVRIYNHALSAKEVKEIAKGLVLHYKLDNSDTFYDVSGYNHAATINAITWSSLNPRYSMAAHFGSTSSKIHITNFPTSGFGNSYSFAWWGKRSSNSPMFWGFSDGIRLNGMYLGNLWNTGDSSNNPLYKIGTTTQVTVPSVNVWHHYVMTGNGTKCYVYLDGELWAEAKTYKAISGTSIYLNGWDSGTSYCSDNTDMSDFRIYATALSAEDILELYHTSASIDHDGNVYAREFNNVESLDNFEINHRGQMIPVDKFVERDEKLASIIKNDDVLGGYFYEY